MRLIALYWIRIEINYKKYSRKYTLFWTTNALTAYQSFYVIGAYIECFIHIFDSCYFTWNMDSQKNLTLSKFLVNIIILTQNQWSILNKCLMQKIYLNISLARKVYIKIYKIYLNDLTHIENKYVSTLYQNSLDYFLVSPFFTFFKFKVWPFFLVKIWNNHQKSLSCKLLHSSHYCGVETRLLYCSAKDRKWRRNGYVELDATNILLLPKLYCLFHVVLMIRIYSYDKNMFLW